jgi:hypothetical protein
MNGPHPDLQVKSPLRSWNKLFVLIEFQVEPKPDHPLKSEKKPLISNVMQITLCLGLADVFARRQAQLYHVLFLLKQHKVIEKIAYS